MSPHVVPPAPPCAPESRPSPAGPTEAERLARVALNRLAEPGDPRVGALVDELGAERLHLLLRGEHQLGGLRDDLAARLAGCDPARELEQATRAGLRFLVPGDDEWPHRLDDLLHAPALHERGGPPVGLWVRGPLRLDALERSVALVGSRSATSYGAQVATDLAREVAAAGVAVVSGAAFGIDQAAHRGALVGDGPTVAVLACGADQVYPSAHRTLIDHLARHGAVVSEAPPGDPPRRIRFLARNRLIAALTGGTVVVEAALRSGALNTASWASRLHRPVLGVPGPVTSAASQGVHLLLRRGEAVLVTSGEEVLEVVGLTGEHLLTEPRAPATRRDRLTARQRQVLDALPATTAATTAAVARAAGLGVLDVRADLARLQTAGLVGRDETGWRLAADADRPAR